MSASPSISSPLRARRLVALVLSCAPIALLWWQQVIVHPRPFWVHHYDPELIYFSQGTRLLHGQAPSHVDNPGTPVQLLSAAILAITGTGPGSVDDFRLLAYCVSLGSVVLAAWLLLKTVLVGLSVWLQVASVWTYFLAPQALEYLEVWSPEALMALFGSAACALAWRFFSGPTPRRALLLGAAIGSCLALKLTFMAWLPAVAIGVVVDRRGTPKARLQWLGAVGAGAITGFVLFTAVVASHYGHMASWVLKLSTHNGPYGSGEYGQPSLPEILTTAGAVIGSAKAWELLWMLSAALLWIAARSRTAFEGRSGLAAFCVSGILLTHIVAIRGEGALRYLLPAAPLALLLFATTCRDFRRWGAAAATLVVAALFAKASLLDVRTHHQRIRSQSQLRAEVDARVARLCPPKASVLYGWRLPEPSFALRIMMVDDTEFMRQVERLYPRQGHYTTWRARRIWTASTDGWDLAVLSDEDAAGFPQPLGPPVSRFGDYGFYTRGDRCTGAARLPRSLTASLDPGPR